MRKQLFIAAYAAMFLHFLRKTLDRNDLAFKAACNDFERRRDRFLSDFRKANPDNPFFAPVLPFSPPLGYRESDVGEEIART